MEPVTMSDVKELMKELRESIRETVAEAFGNSNPALEHATTSNASQLLTMDASDAKVPTPACSSPDQGTSAFDPSPTATIYILSELEVDTTGLATPTPVTCSTEWSPKQPIDVPVLVASSSLTLTEYGLDATPTSGTTTTSMVSDVSVCAKSPSTWSLSQDATATMKEHKGTHEWNFLQQKRLPISFLASMKLKSWAAGVLSLQDLHLLDLVMTSSHVSSARNLGSMRTLLLAVYIVFWHPTGAESWGNKN